MVYGWDSGIDQIFNPEMYGRSFHFSTITAYGLLYYFSSKHLGRVNIKGGKNIIYSICLVALNAMIFELVYMATFQHFQLRRNLVEWLINDFWFLQQYFSILLLGTVGTVGIYFEHEGHWTMETPSMFLSVFSIALFIFWILYPFPVETISYGLWTNNRFFPQTHYAYVHPTVYVANSLLHSVNVGVKALFAYLQLHWLTRLRLCKIS